MGFAGRAGLVLLLVLLSVFSSNRLLLSRLAPAGEIVSSLHVVCRGPRPNISRADVLFHHGEYGSALQFLAMMEELAKHNVSSCSFDRPGYGFSPEPINASTVLCPVRATVHVGHSVGGMYALSCKRRQGKHFVLLDPLLGDSVHEDWTKYRVWLARPIDNDYLLIQTGFARLLRILRQWQPW